MKTVTKEIEISIAEHKVSGSGSKITLDIPSNCFPTLRSLTLTHEVDVPETIQEFCETNCVTKKELVEWLIKNYKN